MNIDEFLSHFPDAMLAAGYAPPDDEPEPEARTEAVTT